MRQFAGVRARRQAIDIGDCYAEATEPRGATRTVLLLHRGGWSAGGRVSVRNLRSVSSWFQSRGCRTLSVTYRNGIRGIDDAMLAFDLAGERWGCPPACVYGESSGGHWALMMALRGSMPALTIAAAAPTDLLGWPEMMSDPRARDYVTTLVGEAFGPGPATVGKFSPARQEWTSEAAARLLLLYADDDPLVPPEHGKRMVAAAPGAELLRLPAGDAPWIHLKAPRGVNSQALMAAFRRVEARLEEAQ